MHFSYTFPLENIRSLIHEEGDFTGIFTAGVALKSSKIPIKYRALQIVKQINLMKHFSLFFKSLRTFVLKIMTSNTCSEIIAMEYFTAMKCSKYSVPKYSR